MFNVRSYIEHYRYGRRVCHTSDLQVIETSGGIESIYDYPLLKMHSLSIWIWIWICKCAKNQRHACFNVKIDKREDKPLSGGKEDLVRWAASKLA